MNIPKAGDECKHCGMGVLVQRESKFGTFMGCDQFPLCAEKKSLRQPKSDIEKQADALLKANKII